MSTPQTPLRQAVVLVVAVLVLASVVPGLAAAQSGVGGTIVVEEGETVSEVSAVGGSIVVHGTVTGDVSGAAGNVLITGTVDGDVSVATGNLEISGDVGGDVSAGAGNVHLVEGATVGGNFDVGAGQVRIDGAIDGDARIGAETIHLGENASIGGSLTYDGALEGNREAVAGDITRDRTLGPTSVGDLQPLASWVFTIYAFVGNLLLGAVLLALFPRFSEGVADQVAGEPIKTGLVGLGVIVGVPVLLVLLAITIIGIPLAIAGAFVFAFLVWIGVVYGRFALGMWLLSPTVRERFGSVGDPDRIGRFDRRWVALIVGLLIGAILGFVPVVGELVNLLIFLLGLGAFALGLDARRRRRQSEPSAAHPTESPTD